MIDDSDEVTPRAARAPGQLPVERPSARQHPVAAVGSVICVFDGSAADLPRLRLAAQAAIASDRPLVVAHLQKWSTRFWAAAFTGHGACIGTTERLAISVAEESFAATVLALIDVATEWEFAACRGGGYRGFRRLIDVHGAGVLVLRHRRLRPWLLLRRLRKIEALTVLAV